MIYKRRYADYKMELLAVRELKRFSGGRYVNGEPCAVPVEELIEKQYCIYIEYHYLRKNMRTLGQMVFDGGYVPIYDAENHEYTLIKVPKNTMIIDTRLTENLRYANKLRFTYAHELSHWLIHKDYFSDSKQSPALIKDNNCGDDFIERQANMLCSYLLIPTGQMKKAYYRLMASGYADTILTEMATLFEVASSTMEIRLREHGLI